MLKKIKNRISIVNDKLLKLNNKFDKTPKWVEMLFWSFFMAFFLIISYFHEPWEDELQSFFIAKETTYYEMIFELGHDEGHPALWWIILSLPAKIGLSADLSLKLISFIFSAISSYLVIFKFKISKVYRVLLPFTYFIFYQYGIVSRCYCIYILGMCLLTLSWNGRKYNPYKTVISMIILCLSSAYGIMISLGLAIVWLYEIFKDSLEEKKNSIGTLIKKHKSEVYALFILAVLGVLLCVGIIPDNDAYAMGIISEYSVKDIVFRLYYMIFIEPIDALFFASTYNEYQLSYEALNTSAAIYVIGTFVSIIYYGCIFLLPQLYGKKRYFIVPRLFYILLGTFTFFMMHHVGITTMLFVFWIVTSYESSTINVGSLKTEKYQSTKYGKFIIEGEGQVLLPYIYLLFILPIFVSINWCISSSVLDITWLYSPNKAVNEKIKEYDSRKFNVASNTTATLNAYNDGSMNTYCSFYNGRKVSFTVLKEKEEDFYVRKKEYGTMGFPDIVTCAGSPGDELNFVNTSLGEKIPDYILIDFIPSGKIFKGVQGTFEYNIFMRKDLADELGGLGRNYIDLKNIGE